MGKVAYDLGLHLPAQTDVDEVFERFDLNKDGKISFEEFENLVKTFFEEQK